MTRDLFQFRWAAYPETYEWRELRRRQPVEPESGRKPRLEPFLVTPPAFLATSGMTAPTAGPGSGPRVEYEPLAEYTGLFRVFADTEPTNEGILEFARQFGHLGVGVPVDAPRSRYHFILEGEALAEWQQEIWAMRDAVRMSDLLKKGDLVALNQHISGPNDDWLGSDPPTPIVVVRRYDSHPQLRPGEQPREGKRFRVDLAVEQSDTDELQSLLRGGDAATAARAYLWKQVNERVEKHTCSRLLFAPDGRQLGYHVSPQNLLGALWMQLAQDIDSNRAYRECEFCSNWFELLPRMRRKNTVYCSRSCRSAAYRDRQEQARRLRAKGKSFAAIAKQLGSDPETVRGWVEANKS